MLQYQFLFLTDFTDEMATAGTEIEQKIVISSNLNGATKYG
jgi:hypothetical protein